MIDNIYKRPELLLQQLIRFNTTNPPGNERACIEYIKSLFDEAGIENKILVYKNNDHRPNLYAKLKGKGTKSPILLYGHVDVVPVKDQKWSVDPFEGEIKDGCVWGRGAVDMKGEIAMFLCTMLKIKKENLACDRDIIFIALSDEEGTGECGAQFVTAYCRDMLQGVKYAFGEIGGFSTYIDNKKVYPIMIGEKQPVHLKITAKGGGGHASMINHDTPMVKICNAVVKLDKTRLPVRVTPPVSYMLHSVAKVIGGIKGRLLKTLLVPNMTDFVLDIMGAQGKMFDALLHNTVNSTMIKGGSAVNVIAGEVSLEVDLRLLPGVGIDKGIEDIISVIGNDYMIEIVDYNESVHRKINKKFFHKLEQALRKVDKHAIAVPYVLAASTDSRFFNHLGITTYGFTPMDMPRNLEFTQLPHSADERIPVKALYFGVKALIGFFVP